MACIDSTIQILGESILIPAYVKQVSLALVLGMLIGAERGWHKKLAGQRTFAVIAVGSCLYTLLSICGNSDPAAKFDVTRIAAQIVTGIGFVGGGVIFKTTNHVEGVTTAALIWLAGAVGMSCGFNKPEFALVGFLAFFIIEGIGFTTRRLRIAFHSRTRSENDEEIIAREG